jgi:NADH dehydrogenase
MHKTEIVILGGGYAGIAAAKKLHKNFRKNPEVSITLVDQNPFHGLITELHEVAGYRIEEDGVKIPLKHILQYTKVKLVIDKIEKVELENNKVILQNGELSYDYLIVAVGSEASAFNIPGVKEYSFPLWSIKDAVKIRDHIIHMFESAQAEKDSTKRQELLTFVVGGGGFTGVEMMGELVQWTKSLAREYKINPQEIRLIVVEALPTICHSLTEPSAKKIHKFLEKKGVEILIDSPITKATPNSIILNEQEEIKTRTLIWASGIQANRLVKKTGLKLAKRNRIEVNQYLQAADHSQVYAIGDNAYSIDEKGRGVPPFVEAALQTAEVAAYNITNDINGIKEYKEFTPAFHGIMVSLGSVYAVADIMKIRMSWIFATAMKHLVNLHYIFGVGGIESCIEYLQHHFLPKARRKPLYLEILVDHFNAKSRSYWLAITRIALGFVWLASALDKISQGWLSAGDKLVSGATLQLIGPNTPAFYAWFVENIIYSNPLLFQTLITLTELFVGITFLSGAFTFLGALAGVFMNINFMLSGTGELYLLLAHIPMLGGAGRAFGLDHYLMPYLMNKLRFLQRR